MCTRGWPAFIAMGASALFGSATLLGSTPVAASASPPGCSATFTVVPSTNPGTSGNDLHAVAAIGAADVWAVGDSNGNTLLEHWNGTAWSTVTGANLSSTPQVTTSFAGVLNAVAASGTSDVWAVGNSDLIEHWNGSAWSTVASAGTSSTALSGVWASGPNDAWIVGGTGSAGFEEHWNGTSWATSSGVDSATTGWTSVSGSATGGVWAFGPSAPSNPTTNSMAAEHWDGTSWTSKAPNPNQVANSWGVPGGIADAGVSATFIGDYAMPINGNSPGNLNFQMWNGATWTDIGGVGAQGPPDYALYGASAAAANDVWFVGSDGAASTTSPGVENPPEPFAEHYDGSQFTAVPSVDPNTTMPTNGSSTPDGQYNGVAAITGEVWAVGYSMDTSTGNDDTLIETACLVPATDTPETPTPVLLVPIALLGLGALLTLNRRRRIN